MSPLAPRPPRSLLTGLLVVVAACGDTCAPGLQQSDLTAYQSCAQDTDCLVVSLTCNDCNSPVSVSSAQQPAYDGLRGCWPDPAGGDTQCPTTEPGDPCPAAICSRSRCTVSPGCPTTGFGGATTGFTAAGTTFGGTSGTFTAGSTSGGGGFPICAACDSPSDCASTYCNLASAINGQGFCDSLSYCTDDTPCAPFRCDIAQGICQCASSTSTAAASTGGTGTTGSSGTTGTHSSMSGATGGTSGGEEDAGIDLSPDAG